MYLFLVRFTYLYYIPKSENILEKLEKSYTHNLHKIPNYRSRLNHDYIFAPVTDLYIIYTLNKINAYTHSF